MGSGFGSASLDKATASLIKALVSNRTPQAFQGVTGLLGGKLKVAAADQAVVQALLQELANSSSPQHRQLLQLCILFPQRVRSAGGGNGKITPAQLQLMALKLTQGKLPGTIRQKLAQNLPRLPAESQKQVLPLLLAPSVDNIPAQVTLYTQVHLPAQQQAYLERLLAEYARQLLLHGMGLPWRALSAASGGSTPFGPGFPGGLGAPGAPGGSSPGGEGLGAPGPGGVPGAAGAEFSAGGALGPGGIDGPGMLGGEGMMPGMRGGMTQAPRVPQLNEQQMAQIVPLLWSSSMIDRVAAQVRAQRGLAMRSSLLQLAAVMPFPKVRNSLDQLVQQHWAGGPQAWSGKNWGMFEVVDPGLLFVLRQAPRQSRDKTPRPGRRNTGGNNPFGGAGPAGGFPGGGAGPAGEISGGGFPQGGQPFPTGNKGSQDPKLAWNDATEDLVFHLCSRFAQAGVRSPSKGDVKSLPIRIPSTYTVLKQYHCSLPADVPRSLGSKSNWPRLKVHFLRLSRKGAINNVARPFQRKAKRHLSFARSYWLEYFQEQGDRLVSMDVLIYPKPGVGPQAPARGASRQRGSRNRRGGQEFFVDVLYLEVAR